MVVLVVTLPEHPVVLERRPLTSEEAAVLQQAAGRLATISAWRAVWE